MYFISETNEETLRNVRTLRNWIIRDSGYEQKLQGCVLEGMMWLLLEEDRGSEGQGGGECGSGEGGVNGGYVQCMSTEELRN